ncbi:hypothetical protein HPP92_025285 [Vanilla planifolia]|uniref:Uncharacterized protein n=1 Tax=Vanilla planifolia TaxID=51239 RepID=A0A835UAV7_VANPL|nr:hypothetical protein HPP92_025285 [Vanilla planifolia]
MDVRLSLVGFRIEVVLGNRTLLVQVSQTFSRLHHLLRSSLNFSLAMAKRGVPYALVNAFKSFLSRESRGLLAGGVEVDDHWMQGIAAELNVSDTAFLTPASGLALASSIARFYLRWFTPVAEVSIYWLALWAYNIWPHTTFESGVKAPPGSGFDFFTRFFCPKLGVNEDPVCGSVHCALVPYWSKKLGKNNLIAYQASPRGGVLDLELTEEGKRVLIRGPAVTVMTGSILV